MTVSLKVGRQSLEIGLDAAIEVNNRLSAQYKTEANPDKRREIIGILYRLNLPLLKKWRVFNFEEKEDYEQEAFFWVSRALDTFDPAKGAFLAWLKKYYTKKSQHQHISGQTAHQNSLEAAKSFYDGEAPEPFVDSLFWRDAEKALGDDWPAVRGVFFEGQTLSVMAKTTKVPRKTLEYRYNKAMDTLRVHLAKYTSKPGTPGESPGEGEWLGPVKFCRKMEISRRYLEKMLHPEWDTNCPYFINPLHVTPIQGWRIRYLFTPSRGLVYPEILKKKDHGRQEER